MLVHSTKLRVRYGETDQMGVVYHGNYAQFYEVGRIEMLRSIGLDYRWMEDNGIIMPVLEMKGRFLKPALYDDEITVKVIQEKMSGIKIHFKYELYNPQNELIHVGETLLAFLNKETKRPCLPPQEFIDRIKPYFD